MFEDLRAQASVSFEEEEETPVEEMPRQVRRQFLGMTPVQRFVISLMLLLITCILGAFFLLVMEKVVPPFL